MKWHDWIYILNRDHAIRMKISLFSCGHTQIWDHWNGWMHWTALPREKKAFLQWLWTTWTMKTTYVFGASTLLILLGIIESTTSDHDLWGYPINLFDPSDGWTWEKRESFHLLQQQLKYQPKAVPQLTPTGFKRTQIPAKLYTFILNQRRNFALRYEKCAQNFAHQNCFELTKDGQLVRKNNTGIFSIDKIESFIIDFFIPKELIPFEDDQLVQNVINRELQPILEEWSGIRWTSFYYSIQQPLSMHLFHRLKPSLIYGIRRYLKGASLALHVDRLSTHVVSAILQIDQNVDQEWPLMIVDLDNKSRKINMKPGDMLLYESAKLPHGRMVETCWNIDRL